MTPNADKKYEVVRCTRVLEYVGPRWWVEMVMKQNGITGTQPKEFGNNRIIREVSITTVAVPHEGT